MCTNMQAAILVSVLGQTKFIYSTIIHYMNAFLSWGFRSATERNHTICPANIISQGNQFSTLRPNLSNTAGFCDSTTLSIASSRRSVSQGAVQKTARERKKKKTRCFLRCALLNERQEEATLSITGSKSLWRSLLINRGIWSINAVACFLFVTKLKSQSG